jgi:hypothetical protein
MRDSEKKAKLIRGVKILHIGELHNVYSVSDDIIRAIKLERVSWLERREFRVEFMMKACDTRAWTEIV